jgi:hypothetical protein
MGGIPLRATATSTYTYIPPLYSHWVVRRPVRLQDLDTASVGGLVIISATERCKIASSALHLFYEQVQMGL